MGFGAARVQAVVSSWTPEHGLSTGDTALCAMLTKPQIVGTSTKLKEAAQRQPGQPKWESDEVEVKTVDSYQRAETRIAMLDVTVANFGRRTNAKSSKAADVDMIETAENPEDSDMKLTTRPLWMLAASPSPPICATRDD